MTHYLYLAKYNTSNIATNARVEIASRALGQSASSHKRWNAMSHIVQNLQSVQSCDSNTTDTSKYSFSPNHAFSQLNSLLTQTVENDIVEDEAIVEPLRPLWGRATDATFVSDEPNCADDQARSYANDDDAASVHSLGKSSTASSSSSSCSVSFDSCYSSGTGSACQFVSQELAKRCQQCREIIIAAKEKQEGEARKNANCLLEQIEQEEEERANREAMQARKRERKRMKRKAKQEKERQGKEPSQTMEPTNRANPVARPPTEDLDNADGSSSEQINSTLSDAVRQVRKSSIISLRSETSNPPDGSNEFEPEDSKVIGSQLASPTKRSVSPTLAQSRTRAFVSEQSNLDTTVNGDILSDAPGTRIPSADNSSSKASNPELFPGRVSAPSPSATATTEAKREKHRNKKQSQRAAKRAANEHLTNSEVDRAQDEDPSSPTATGDSGLTSHPVTSAYYPVPSNGDSELNWNALIDSQNSQYGQYFYNGMVPTTSAENNSWTVVLPSNSTRTQRAANSSTTGGRTGTSETTDWKTTSSSSSSSKRRIFISVSRHDIGKVIGQGGAVVSALRNMSGIQIDIESARSDEAPDRMVYLRGPSDAVQRTYEAIQGLLNGSLAGNDVLLMYAAMKKSTTTANSTVGKNILSALTSKASGAVTLTTASTTSKVIPSTGRGGSTSGKSRKNAKVTSTTASSSATTSAAVRSSSIQPTALTSLNRTTVTAGKVTTGTTSSNSNNNSTVMCCTSTSSSPAVSTIMSTRVTNANATSWSSKVSGNLSSSTKGNFAAVAASGLAAHTPRAQTKVTDSTSSTKGSVHAASKYTTVPNLMSTFPVVTPTTAPVSLLSLNVSPFSTTSQMFPDLALSFSATNDLPPDSLDEVSFPPLNPKARPPPGTVNEEQDAPATSSTSGSVVTTVVSMSSTDTPTATVVSMTSSNDAIVLTTVPSDTNTSVTPSAVVDSSDTPSSAETLEAVHNDTSLPIFKPLTVSPPVPSGAPASQPPTPVGSGSSYSTSCVGTSPATTTQTRSFARAPGSERSAHQRGTTVCSVANPVSEAYPPSLMSLDVTTGLSRQTATVLGENLLTPTKRATSPELHESDFRPPGVQGRFRPGQQTDWLSSELKSNTTVATSVFPKTPGFPLDSSVDLTSNVSLNPPMGTSQTQISAASKGSFRTSEPLHSGMAPGWPIPPTGLNPNAAAFQPSAFQQPKTTAHQSATNAHIASTVESSVSMVSAAGLRTDFSDLSSSEGLSGAYNMDAALVSSGMRSTGSMKPGVPTGLHQPIAQQTPSLPVGSLTGTVPSSVAIGSSNFATHNSMASNVRPKPLLSVTPNMYVDQRSPSQNGMAPSNVCISQQLQSSSSLLNNAQLRPMYATGQQSAPTQQQQSQQPQPSLSANHLPSVLNQGQQSGVSTRLGGGTSPHPMLSSQTQIPIGPSSYTPPPYVPGFIQPSAPGQAPNSMSMGATHPGGNYNPHMLNGVGPSAPLLSGGTLIGASTSMHQSSAVQAPPIQPIGAERRRQAVTTLASSGAPPSNMIYSAPTSNGTGLSPFSLSNTTLGNQSSALHPQAPSPQQPPTASNPNGLFMALTMNWVQQQQQQQQQQSQQQSQPAPQHWLGGAGSSHTGPASWQTPLWPPSTVGGSFPSAGASSGPIPSSKLSTGAIPDYGAFNSVNLVPSALSGGGSSDNQQQQQQTQQSMVAAAMAAVAGMYPWTGAASTVSSGIGNANTSLGSGQNRWVYPSQLGSGYPNASPAPPPQPAFFDPLTSMKPSGAHHSGGGTHHVQSVHRPAHE